MMNRREPHPLPSWALEHLTSRDRDDALCGDLLEAYHAGRSETWYWRQVLAVCILSWSQSLTARGPALVFALGWSWLAPTWKTAIDHVPDPLSFGRAWQMLGPFWLPFALAGWMALHAAFLWAGLLVYQSAHALAGQPLARKDLRRAFWIATFALPIISAVTSALAAIYHFSWPALAHAKLASTALGQITDPGILPDLIRIPYFLALLGALWPTIPRPRRYLQEPASGANAQAASIDSDTIAPAEEKRPADAFRVMGIMVGAGFLNALIASLLVCRLLPDVTEPNLNSLLLRALFFVIVAAAGGVIGTYIYWQNPWTSRQQQTPIPFPLLVLVCASGWVWVPSLLIFGASLSAGVAIVAMIGTYTLVAGLRHAAGLIDAPLQTGVSLASPRTSSLFEESLYRPPANLTGYAIALSLYGAGALLAARDDYGAAALLALAAALFAWNRTVPRERSLERPRQYLRAAFRVAMILVPAILVTAWALLDGVTLRKRAAAASDNSGPALSGVGRNRKSMVMTVAHGADGYESVILWPVPQKKQIVPPISSPYALFGTDNKQPLVIRFDGPYRYVQPPNKLPGPNVHQARGTPLEFDIHSSNSLPVTMQAHQDLFGSIPVARCREIDVEIENRDNLAGRVSLALLLTTGSSTRGRTIVVGQQVIATTQPENFAFKAAPVRETLRFAVPPSLPAERFGGFTVLLLPDIEHTFVAPRIAVEQFEIFPR
jgi:hypothetical protein